MESREERDTKLKSTAAAEETFPDAAVAALGSMFIAQNKTVTLFLGGGADGRLQQLQTSSYCDE